MLEASPRWNRQRLATLEAVDFEIRRLFSGLYFISGTSASIYVAGWLRFNILDLPAGPLTYFTIFAVFLTVLAGVLHALTLPAIALALGVERLLQRRIGKMDRTLLKAKGNFPSEVQCLPNGTMRVWGGVGSLAPMPTRRKRP